MQHRPPSRLSAGNLVDTPRQPVEMAANDCHTLEADQLVVSSSPASVADTSISEDGTGDPSISEQTAAETPSKVAKKARKKRWKWPEGKPKRPLTAYNFFFQHERVNIIKAAAPSNAKEDDSIINSSATRYKSSGVGFAGLARKVAEKWKTLDRSEKEVFEAQAAADKRRYHAELVVWERNQRIDPVPFSASTQLLGGGSQAGDNESMALAAKTISKTLLSMAAQAQMSALQQFRSTISSAAPMNHETHNFTGGETGSLARCFDRNENLRNERIPNLAGRMHIGRSNPHATAFQTHDIGSRQTALPFERGADANTSSWQLGNDHQRDKFQANLAHSQPPNTNQMSTSDNTNISPCVTNTNGVGNGWYQGSNDRGTLYNQSRPNAQQIPGLVGTAYTSLSYTAPPAPNQTSVRHSTLSYEPRANECVSVPISVDNHIMPLDDKLAEFLRTIGGKN